MKHSEATEAKIETRDGFGATPKGEPDQVDLYLGLEEAGRTCLGAAREALNAEDEGVLLKARGSMLHLAEQLTYLARHGGPPSGRLPKQ